jgi:hypothetical protein
MSGINEFLLGAAAALAVVASLFFLRYWRLTRDRLFLGFSAAFVLLAVNWGLAAGVAPANESRHWIYLLRLLAFLVILAAIVDKNRDR